MNLRVDEGYAFDYLSILYIKNKQKPSDQNLKNWQDCFFYLKNQIDNKLWDEIIESNEMKSIIQANQKTFEAVEKARYGKISAKKVDNCNMERYISKIKLQNKFFPNSKVIEKKS
jgi:hypothetical protein